MTLPRVLLVLAAFCLSPLAASANVITDWDEKAVALLQPRFVPPVAYRAMAIIELAMFEAGIRLISITSLTGPCCQQVRVCRRMPLRLLLPPSQ
jgi:hypothetical protein